MASQDQNQPTGQQTQQPANTTKMLQEARQTVPEVTPAQAKQQLDRGEVAVVLDVREPNEWERGHIPGAVHTPRGMLEWYADASSPYGKPELTADKDARIVVQCASGGRSLLAARTLQQMGYTNVSSMSGGFNDWAKQGFPVETPAEGEKPTQENAKG